MVKFILIAAGLAAASAHGLSLDWRVSRVHGLVNFAETISGDAHRSRSLKEAFDQSPTAAAFQGAIERFKKARARHEVGWTFPGYPVDRAVGQTLEKLVLIQSAFSVDLEDFGRRVFGYVPPADQMAYLAALKEIDPAYESLVWAPSFSKLTAQRNRLVEMAKDKNMAGLFDKAAAFYRAQWPESLPLTIALYPIPGATGHGSAESIDGLESLGVFVDREDGGEPFGVLFHELCHSLYEAQTAAFQVEWEGWFRSGRSESADPAYGLINEALATALGNGWAQEKAGKARSGSWYDNAYIDKYAKEIYPLVKAYVEVPKPVDKEFVQKAIAAFDKAVPGAAYDYAFRLRRAVLAVDGKMEPVRRELRKRFNVASLESASSVDSGLEEIKKSWSTAIVVVGRDSISELGKVEKAIPGLKVPWAALRGRSGPVVFASYLNHRPVLLIRADGEKEIAEAFHRISRQKRIEAKASFLLPVSEKT